MAYTESWKQRMIEQEERLREGYRKEGWGRLAEEAGFDPVHTEGSARMAFRFMHGRLETIKAICEDGERSGADRLDEINAMIAGLIAWPGEKP
jgi:hypothetical protein